LLLIDLDPPDQHPDELPSGGPVGLCQPFTHAGGEHLEVAQHQTQLLILLGECLEFAGLLLQVLEPFPHVENARLELLFVEESLRIPVDQAGHAPLQLGHLALHGAHLLRIRGGLQALAILLVQPLRLFQEPTDFLPHGLIEAIHPDLLVPTQPCAPRAGDIRTTAAIVGVAGVVGASTVGVPTLCADEQALQQVAAPLTRNAGSPLVFRELLTNRGKERLVHQSGNGNADPFLFRDLP
jgi:hypothetical protein